MLIDDIKLFDNCVEDNNCESTCSYTSGSPDDINYSTTHNGTAPLTFWNLHNISNLSFTVSTIAGGLLDVFSFNCPNGWEDTLGINLNHLNLSTANYLAQVAISNDCGSCLKNYIFEFQDYYNQGEYDCSCRPSGIIKKCCENSYEAEQVGFNCGNTKDSITHRAIDNLSVGVAQAFEIDDSLYYHFTASNSIYFGNKFNSGNGTFLAEINPCSLNKRSIETNENENLAQDSNIVLSKIFPNPTDGILFIPNPQFIEQEVTIYTMSGQMVLKEFSNRSDPSPIDLSTLKSGAYYVKTSAVRTSSVWKVILAK